MNGSSSGMRIALEVVLQLKVSLKSYVQGCKVSENYAASSVLVIHSVRRRCCDGQNYGFWRTLADTSLFNCVGEMSYLQLWTS